MAFILIILLLHFALSEGWTNFDDLDVEEQLKILNKPAVRSFQSGKGDIFDCVDMFKQPAFDHPLLRNHKIQMRPTAFPEGKGAPRSINASSHSKLMGFSCPKGTVPIRRTTKEELLTARSLSEKSRNSTRKLYIAQSYYRAGVISFMGNYYGAKAALNVWKPYVEGDDQYSAALVSVTRDGNDIQAGWMNNDDPVRCINTLCPGFVTTGELPLGAQMSWISQYNDPNKQHAKRFHLFRDANTKNWWLKVGRIGVLVGYWPSELIPKLTSDGAKEIFWGGQVYPGNKRIKRLRNLEMGSGHFPEEGYAKAAFVSKIMYALHDGPELINPSSDQIDQSVDKPSCYDVDPDVQYSEERGYYIFYGGKPNNFCPD
ncbi:protein neprosin-like [Musa acuminata AAA Group]|uniref:protein neprosin-like n=1 Tax=Musa acuminata AAA Group TaxID=214697 RepID=UPI0031E01FE1